MSIKTLNSSSLPKHINGATWFHGDPGVTPAPQPTSLTVINQVAGLVPVFPCVSPECRQGKFMADSIADDTLFPLNVFVSNDPLNTDNYFNDKNSWLFELPSNYLGLLDFYIDKLVNGTWVQQVHLTDNVYGTYYAPIIMNSPLPDSKYILCAGLDAVGKVIKNWAGYVLDWKPIAGNFGTGMFRFRVNYQPDGTIASCFSSPTFCLNILDCYNSDRSTKFEAIMSGGRLGSVTKNGCSNYYWDFCCTSANQLKNKNVVNLFKAVGDSTITQPTNPPFSPSEVNCYPYGMWRVNRIIFPDVASRGGFNNCVCYNNATGEFTVPADGYYTLTTNAYDDYWIAQNNTPSAPGLGVVQVSTFFDVYNSGGFNSPSQSNSFSFGSNYIKTIYMKIDSKNWGKVTGIFGPNTKVPVSQTVYLLAGQKLVYGVDIRVTNASAAFGCLLKLQFLQDWASQVYYIACLDSQQAYTVQGSTNPIFWYDSIRIPGFFGREEKDYERNQIKYQTGIVNKIRDEAISKFKWRSFGQSPNNPGSGLPFWFHERFSNYALMADQLLVSDYNINNSDYTIKRICVIADGGYQPEYKGHSRYSNVTVDFKAQNQYQIRQRCC